MITIIWVLLFPALFMIHDFEEIIYGHSWFKRNIKKLKRRFQQS
ncbi:MAG: HXXEE domain-containing protein [Pseudolactococcus laudensis]